MDVMTRFDVDKRLQTMIALIIRGMRTSTKSLMIFQYPF